MSVPSDRDLVSAACHENLSFISSWFSSLTDEERQGEICRAKLGIVLRKASLHHNFSVVKLVLQLSKEKISG